MCTLQQILIHDEIMKSEKSGACSTHGRNEKCILNLSNNLKSPLERHRRKREDNIKMYLKEIGYHVAHDKWLVVGPFERINEKNFFNVCPTVSFSRRTLHHGFSQ